MGQGMGEGGQRSEVRGQKVREHGGRRSGGKGEGRME